MNITFFASGSNHSGEIRALSLVDGANVGVVADRVKTTKGTYGCARAELLRFPGCVFIDSGAFEEVKFPGGVPTIVKPLGAAHWDMVFSVYKTVARELMERAYLVAPDCVAHQRESLERFERYAERSIELWELGANVLVPIQKGAISMAEYAYAVDDAMDGASWIPSIPMKKDATSLEELSDFCETYEPTALHLLGCAPDSHKGKAAIAAVRAILPNCELSCDACLVGRWNGRNNGPKHPVTGKNTPRRYTLASDFHIEKLKATAAAHGIEIDGHTETHLRKCLSFYMISFDYWTKLGLADIVIPEGVVMPEDVATELEPMYALFAAKLFANREGTEA